MSAKIHLDELEPEHRKALGITKPRESLFSADDVRSHAIRCLAPIAALTQAERERVLRHALRMNKVKTR